MNGISTPALCQENFAPMSAAHENVLSVPSRNVLLTRSGWEGGRTRSSHHESAGTRPSGSAEKSTEEANHTTASSRRVTAERMPGEAVVGQAARCGRPCGCAWAAPAAVEPAAEGGHVGERRADFVAGDVSRVRTDASQRI